MQTRCQVAFTHTVSIWQKLFCSIMIRSRPASTMEESQNILCLKKKRTKKREEGRSLGGFFFEPCVIAKISSNILPLQGLHCAAGCWTAFPMKKWSMLVQMIAAGKTRDGKGVLLGLHKGRVLREVYRSQEELPSPTGLWSLPLHLQDLHHSAVALSFMTSSRLLSAGHFSPSMVLPEVRHDRGENNRDIFFGLFLSEFSWHTCCLMSFSIGYWCSCQKLEHQ